MVLSMERWIGKVAIVTGASSGIGAAIAERLVKEGLQVLGIARRVELIELLAKRLYNENGKLYPFKCNVMVENELMAAFSWCKSTLGPVHILINNAGIFANTNLINGDTTKWKEMFDTNVLAPCIATREAVKDMTANNVDGHIVHMNSVGGHCVPYFKASNVYPASKHAITALTETLRQELNAFNMNIKITSISPGLVKTDIFKDCEDELIEEINKAPSLDCQDVVDAVIYVLSTGPNVQVHDIIIKPLHEKF